MRRVVRVALVALLTVVASAHVGSPDTWFSGNAGVYRILVHIRAPGVIPGVAEVTVQVQGDEDVREVLANVNRYDAVTAQPPPDRAERLSGQPNTFRTKLWVMTGGSNSFTVRVRGDRGEGVTVVPATIVAFRRLSFSGPRAALLGVVGVFLFIGLVSIVGAAVREGVLQPGEQPSARKRRSARTAMAGTAAVVALLLFGGKKWWDSEDSSHRERMFRPLDATARVDSTSGRRVLRVVIADSTWRRPNVTGAPGGAPRSRFTPLVPDHGKLMHLFAIRDDLGAIAHLHPETSDTVTFVARLPELPAGRYRVYGDITHESGFAQTIPATVALYDGEETTTEQVPGSAGDDSWYAGQPATSSPSRVSLDAAKGIMMTWERNSQPIIVGIPAPLRFRVHTTTGDEVALEPYMGMAAHAVIARDDGSVFIHLHPMGTISAAAELALAMREASDTVAGTLGRRVTAADSARTSHAAHLTAQNVLSFPYAFPATGNYAVWVQVKHEGRVLTGAFAVNVREGEGR